MSNQSDQEYFAERAIFERHMSAMASDPDVANIHEQMADEYEKLATGSQRRRPRLTIAARS